MENAPASKGWRNPTVIAAIIGAIAAIFVAIIGLLPKTKPQEVTHIEQQTPGNTPQVEATGGVAVGRDLRDSNITFGFTSEQVQKLMQRSNQELKTTDQAQVKELSQRLGVPQDTIMSFIDIIKREQVSPERLPERLSGITQRYLEMENRIAFLESEKPTIKALIDTAQTAIKKGDYDHADSLIDKAEKLHPMAQRVLPQDDVSRNRRSGSHPTVIDEYKIIEPVSDAIDGCFCQYDETSGNIRKGCFTIIQGYQSKIFCRDETGEEFEETDKDSGWTLLLAGEGLCSPCTTFVGEGTVIAVVPSNDQIVVDHKEIKGFAQFIADCSDLKTQS